MKRGLFMNKSNEEEAEILIYEMIGEDWWSGGGVTAKRFTDELKALGNVAKITVRINSPGGDVYDGTAIYNQLVQHKAAVNVFIDGLAASAASYIAMAGDSIKIAENGLMMIHNPWSIAIGESKDMRKTADVLDKIKDTIVLTYQKRTKQDSKEISKWMDAETWMTGKEAVDKGFADEIMEAKSVEASFGLVAQFKNAPESLKVASIKPAHAEFDDIEYLRQRLNLRKAKVA